MTCKITYFGLYFSVYNKEEVAPIDLPHKINFLNPFYFKNFRTNPCLKIMYLCLLFTWLHM
jgi:hypothetical protein